MRLRLRALLAAPVLLATPAVMALPATPAAAATNYLAPLRTAVRQLPVAAENRTGFDRGRYFGDWVDADRDCQNTRTEVLVAEGTRLGYASKGCRVVSGAWKSIYDNVAYTSPTDVQVDHLVPAAEAWGSGARRWTQARRVAFYNDLGVSYSLNTMGNALSAAKKSSGPEKWLPPANVCRYVEVWTATKIRWGLSVDPKERAALVRLADGCPNNPISVPRA